MTECVFVTVEQYVGVVPVAVADADDSPYRRAEPGEAVTPAWFEQSECEEHGERELSWRRISVDRIAAAQSAIAMGCDGGCHCRCHS
jgi:hypothetical protein